MFKSKMPFAPIMFAFFALISFTQTNTPVAAVTSFCKFDRSHSQTFNRRSVDRLKPWLSNSFYRLFLKHLSLQDAYLKQHRNDKPYFGDGLSFMPYDEACESGGKSYRRNYSVTNDSARRGSATVNVGFFYPKRCHLPSIVYKIKLVREGSFWRIDDIIFEDGKSFVADLKRFRY